MIDFRNNYAPLTDERSKAAAARVTHGGSPTLQMSLDICRY
jgi:hypothetical protein